jgi:hypothetical protein
MRSFKEDYKNGIENEKRILQILKNKFNDTEDQIILNKNPYGFYDIEDKINKRFIEIKQRNYKLNKFDDWMLPFSKIIKFREIKKDKRYLKYSFYYIQCNLDDDYYCLLNSKKINKIKYHKRADRIDKTDTNQKYIFIKTLYFKTLKNIGENKKSFNIS